RSPAARWSSRSPRARRARCALPRRARSSAPARALARAALLRDREPPASSRGESSPARRSAVARVEDGERVLAAGPAEGLPVGGRVEEVGATVGADAAVERAADRARRRLEDADHHRGPDAARALVEGSGPDDAAHAAGRHLSAARRGARAGGLGGAAGRAVIAAERLAFFEATAGSARDVVAAEGDAARLGWNARGA